MAEIEETGVNHLQIVVGDINKAHQINGIEVNFIRFLIRNIKTF